ncbi:MAG: nicotinamide riboside transporter PnuC [Gammaproteobacteria bacterium]|nr:nicotinamide riboside transporter PnuC [Gammaproteobacteria bacterium]
MDTLQSLASNLIGGFAAMSVWELLAVLLAFAYLVLAIRQNIWCWVVAAISEVIFMFLMVEAQLYMESALRVFYLAMAAYGWYSWRSADDARASLPVTIRHPRYHLVVIVTIALLVGCSGGLLAHYTDSVLPYWDSFTTWTAMFATWMVARKVFENWYYWFVVDVVSAWLYIERGLSFTACLYLVYLIMIVFGIRAWRRTLDAQTI